MNLLAWWIDRWRKSTAYTDMTLEQQGAYRNLLDEACLRGGAIPDDDRVLAKACGDQRAWKRLKPLVLSRFELQADGWHNTTLDKIMATKRERSVAGVRGNEARWGDRKHHRQGIAKPIAKPIANTVANGIAEGIANPIAHVPSTSSKNDDVTRARASSLSKGLLKPHGNVAFDSPRVWVPWPLHIQLQGLRNNSNADEELQAFYADVSEDWNTGAHATSNVDPEMFNFWRARYAERWPPDKPERPRERSADELLIEANKSKYAPPKVGAR